MASLTPLSKGLIGLAVLGGMASAVWHLGLKDRLGGATQGPAPAQAPTVQSMPAQPPAIATPAPATMNAPPANSANVSTLSVAENAERGRTLLASGDYARARAHLEAAVQGGDGPAACLLGEMTLQGQGGIPANQEQSAKLFQLAQSRNIICFASGN